MATKENSSEVSEFYLACRNGDVEFVENYLSTRDDTKDDLNQYEASVKSTPLHAASYHGHEEIVKLLIEHGCDRSQTNSHGLTAYEEAANDDIRQLFKRPSGRGNSRRFQDGTVDDFDFVKRPEKQIEEKSAPVESKPQNTNKEKTIQGFQTETEQQVEIDYATTSIALCQSEIGRFIADKFSSDSPMSLKSIGMKLEEIISEELIAKKDPDSQKANELLKTFLSECRDGSIEHLIRLYTLETKFYGALRHNPMPLAVPLYIALQTLEDRYFQGQSYRGARMSDDDIAVYEWGMNNPGSIIQIKYFSSTSIERSVAEHFLAPQGKKQNSNRRNQVLIIYNFPKKCNQAINLSRMSGTQPCLSEFQDECEVLLLPWTLFEIESIHKEPPSSYTIKLTNVLLPQKSLLSSLKWILLHPIGAWERFNEYFPKKQPETVVRELTKNLSISDESLSKEQEQ